MLTTECSTEREERLIGPHGSDFRRDLETKASTAPISPSVAENGFTTGWTSAVAQSTYANVFFCALLQKCKPRRRSVRNCDRQIKSAR